MSSIRDTFFEECEDLLEALGEGLAEMAAGTQEDETVNAVFRSVHSIKGGAGAFGLDRLVGFAHRFETVLDRVRSHEIDIDPDLLRLLQRAGDHLGDLVESERDGTELDAAVTEGLLDGLSGFLPEVESEGDDLVFEAVGMDFGAIALPETEPEAKTFAIRFAPARALYANGHDPLLLFDALSRLGELEIEAETGRLPSLDALDPEESYLSWSLRLTTEEPEHAIHEVFEFCEGLCTLEIAPAENATEEISEGEAPAPLPTVPGDPEPGPIPAETLADTRNDGRVAPSGPRPTLRVDLERVDRLINTVGELIINQAVIVQRIEEIGLASGAGLTAELEDYKLLAREIQEGVMAIRAQPVKPLFQRMSRIVREAAEATGKEARLVQEGEGTEVDKTVVERLADPLTHMIRNAIDHGLERPGRRGEIGKDPVGTIRLAAFHRSGSVLIEISDDGAGLDRERILATAISKGLVAPEVELSPAEIDNLLFLPGFSTAAEVSNLSGRGVGMDVVKTAIASLGGRVTISTRPGEGTTFSIVLPLTLAVMDGMVVSVAGQTMVVPIASIVETIRPGESELHRFGVDGDLLAIRGSYVPIVDVAESLGLPPAAARVADQVLLLVQTEGQSQCALAVDGISDQRQVVIKSLEGNYGAVPGISAATILGDGKIALIIDPEAIVTSGTASLHRLPEQRPEKESAYG